MKRRTYLRGSLAGATLALAGCSGDDDSGTDNGNGNAGTDTTAVEEPTTTVEATTSEEVTVMTPDGGPSTTTEAPTTTEATTSEEVTVTTPDDGPTTTTEASTPTTTPTPEPADQVVEVGEGGLDFTPETFTVSVGDTVRWEWKGSGHNVVPNDVPSGTEWEGSPGNPDELHGAGFAFEHTFSTTGEYTYFCRPHRTAGMTGSFTVQE